jgi:hypothetical protein
LNLNGPEKRDRNAEAWRRSLEYQLALLRHRRPDFDDLDLEEQLMLIGNFRRHVYDFLEAQRALTQFLEYGIPEGTPNSVVRNARDQVRAAVLVDVEGLTHREIALKLGVEIPRTYEINMKIPAVKRMVEDGRGILNEALGTGEWSQKAEEIKSDGEHYLSLDDREKVAEELVRRRGLSRETALSLCGRSEQFFAIVQALLGQPGFYR